VLLSVCETGDLLFAITAGRIGYEKSKGVCLATGITAGVRFPARVRDFSLHVVHTGSGAHPASYAMVTRGVKPTTHLVSPI
jgi:hypothetical protein